MSPRSALLACLFAMILSGPALGQYYSPWQSDPHSSGPYLQQQWHAQQQRWQERQRQQRAYWDQQRRAYEQQRRVYQQQQRAYRQRLEDEWRRRAFGQHPRAVEPQRIPRQAERSSPERASGGERPEILPQAPDIVAFANNEEPGTIIIDTEARALYYTVSDSEAYQYPVSVGREGFSWTGTETVSRMADWPDWYPPEDMRKRQPGLPKMMTGGLNNPLGAKALYLGDTLYRIHGTNEVDTVGQAASSGCFRMRNEHVVHLASMVDIGATVKVVKSWPSGGTASSETNRTLASSADLDSSD